MDTSHKRHIAKTISWRIIATTTTMLLAWTISGNVEIGAKVAGLEFVLKMVIYYFHERVWYRSSFGLNTRNSR